MRRTLLILVTAVLAIVGITAAAPAQPAVTKVATAVKAEAVTQQYGSHPRQRLDITWNPSPAPRPAVVLITGGSWYTHASWATNAKQFANQGFQVFIPPSLRLGLLVLRGRTGLAPAEDREVLHIGLEAEVGAELVGELGDDGDVRLDDVLAVPADQVDVVAPAATRTRPSPP